MYLGGDLKALSMKDKVNSITYIKTFIIKLESPIINRVSNYLINSTRNVRLLKFEIIALGYPRLLDI